MRTWTHWAYSTRKPVVSLLVLLVLLAGWYRVSTLPAWGDEAAPEKPVNPHVVQLSVARSLKLNKWEEAWQQVDRLRRHEVTRDVIEFRVADTISSRCGSRVHPRSAHFVGNVEEVKLVRRPGLLEHGAHPPPRAHGIGVKVENDRNAGAQKIDDVRRQRRAQSLATLEEIAQHPDFGIQLRDPAILTDDDRVAGAAEPRGKRRFPGGYLAAQHVQRRVGMRHWRLVSGSGGVPDRMHGLAKNPARRQAGRRIRAAAAARPAIQITETMSLP